MVSFESVNVREEGEICSRFKVPECAVYKAISGSTIFDIVPEKKKKSFCLCWFSSTFPKAPLPYSSKVQGRGVVNEENSSHHQQMKINFGFSISDWS